MSMPTKTGTNPRDRVREIVRDALSRPDEMSLDGLVDEIMEAAGAEGLKNYAMGFMASSFQSREGITFEDGIIRAEQALQEAALI